MAIVDVDLNPYKQLSGVVFSCPRDSARPTLASRNSLGEGFENLGELATKKVAVLAFVEPSSAYA